MSLILSGGSGVSLAQSRLTRTAVKTANYAAGADELVPVDTTSGAVTVTLPTTPADKTQVEVKIVTLGAGNYVTVACGGSDVINKTAGATSLVLYLAGEAVRMQYDASAAVWTSMDRDTPPTQLDARYPLLGGGANVLPSGASYQTLPRTSNVGAQIITSGTIYLTAVTLPALASVSTISMKASGTAAVGLTHSWAGLFDANRVALSFSNDDTSAWNAQANRTFTLTAPQTGLAAGVYYLGFCVVVSTTMPTVYGIAVNSNITVLAPITDGTSTTAQTTVPALPFTAAAISATSLRYYLWTA